MSIFGSLERFLVQLYPYRWPLAGLALIGLLAILLQAYRARWHSALWRHWRLTAALGAVVLAVGVSVGYYTLSPLWTRVALEEASPLEATSPPVMTSPMADPTPGMSGSVSPPQATPEPENTAPTAPVFSPRVVFTGEFQGADDFHFARGRALVIETAPGQFVLRFEEFSVRNGPDLYVYLSPNANGYAESALNLGRLKATDGMFNYEIPMGTDVAQFQSAVVWCRQFSVLFATAPLAAE